MRLTPEDYANAGVAIRKGAMRPDLSVIAVRPSPLPDLVEIEVAGGTMLYGSTDGEGFPEERHEVARHDRRPSPGSERP